MMRPLPIGQLLRMVEMVKIQRERVVLDVDSGRTLTFYLCLIVFAVGTTLACQLGVLFPRFVLF